MTHGPDRGHPQSGGRARRARNAFRGALAALVTAVLLLPAAPAGATRGAVAAADALTTVAAATASASPYELTGRGTSTKPLRWLACRAIAYRINPSGMPSGMDAVIRRSMALIGRQTGVTFRYAGTTKRSFATTSRPSTPTIYFAFTPKHRAYGRTFSWPGEIGVGGPSGSWYLDGKGHVYQAITSGRVLLSTTFHGPRLGAGATWQSLIVHETGHALNLAHRSAAGDVMNPVLGPSSPGRFRADELAALKSVLQTKGCDYKAWSRL